MDKEKIEKVSELKTATEVDHSEVLANVAKVRRELDAIIEMQALIASIRMAAYEAHRKAGFSEKDSIELVKNLSGV